MVSLGKPQVLQCREEKSAQAGEEPICQAKGVGTVRGPGSIYGLNVDKFFYTLVPAIQN